jgi:NADH:ubiquinone oxidoreductase subunit H
MISYEVCIGLIILAVVISANDLNLINIVNAQQQT